MATQTLLEAAKYTNDDLVAGIAENIIDLSPWNAVIPWTSYTGQAIIVNRELTLGDAQFLAVGGDITAKTPSTADQATYTSTKIIADAEIDGLVQAQNASAGVDQMMVEVASKAKAIGRAIQDGTVTGGGTSPQMNSLHSMVDPSQFTPASAGQTLSFELLDECADLVKAKDGEIDWIMMNERTLRQYKVLLRAQGGSDESMVIQMPNGHTRTVSSYEGVPIFKNTYLKGTETANGAALTGGNLSSVYMGVWDDGTKKIGVSMIHPEGTVGGIMVDPIGQKETKDERIVRIKSYMNFVSFNRKGIARLTSIN